MQSAEATIDSAIEGASRLRNLLSKRRTRQVQSVDERASIKVVAMTWFKSQRPAIVTKADPDILTKADDEYRWLLEMGERNTSREVYVDRLRALRQELIQVRSRLLIPPAAIPATQDAPPNFAPLAPDLVMQGILVRRWEEVLMCLAGSAPLAATVMMGGLLEGLLLARLNRMPNKAPAFKAKSAPRDRKTNKTLLLKEWSLQDYIDVGHELGWITQSAKDVGVVLRDYRNYIHPQKEYSHGIVLTADDARVLWAVFKGIVVQLLQGGGTP